MFWGKSEWDLVDEFKTWKFGLYQVATVEFCYSRLVLHKQVTTKVTSFYELADDLHNEPRMRMCVAIALSLLRFAFLYRMRQQSVAILGSLIWWTGFSVRNTRISEDQWQNAFEYMLFTSYELGCLASNTFLWSQPEINYSPKQQTFISDCDLIYDLFFQLHKRARWLVCTLAFVCTQRKYWGAEKSGYLAGQAM